MGQHRVQELRVRRPRGRRLRGPDPRDQAQLAKEARKRHRADQHRAAADAGRCYRGLQARVWLCQRVGSRITETAVFILSIRGDRHEGVHPRGCFDGGRFVRRHSPRWISADAFFASCGMRRKSIEIFRGTDKRSPRKVSETAKLRWGDQARWGGRSRPCAVHELHLVSGGCSPSRRVLSASGSWGCFYGCHYALAVPRLHQGSCVVERLLSIR